MSEPTRFIGSGGLKAKLLASAKEDRPPKGSRRRAVLAAAAAAAASTKAVSATATLSATTLGRWAMWKWIAVGALGAGSVVVAKTVVRPRPVDTTSVMIAPQTLPGNAPALRARRSHASASPPPRSSEFAEALSILPPPPVSPTDLRGVPKVDEARPAAATAEPAGPLATRLRPDAPQLDARMARPELLRTATRTGEGSSVPQSSIPSGSTLSSEIAAIDQAKRALASGDPAAALRRVDDYDAAFPRGTLAAEATALRIEALARTGRLGDARAELARLRATHPHSPLLENLARLVGE